MDQCYTDNDSIVIVSETVEIFVDK
jgi:hypothetical protein